MRHRKSGLKLGKTTSHRQSMFKNMVTSLFKHDRIRTTDVKAKELRRWADHVITLAKRGDLHARRQVMNIIRDKSLVHQLFESASEKYSNRSGGYTRIVKIGRRAGDAAPVSLIELIDSEDTPKSKGAPKAKKAKAAPSAPVVAGAQPSVEKAEETPKTQATSASEEVTTSEKEDVKEETAEISQDVEASASEASPAEPVKSEVPEGEAEKDDKSSDPKA